MNKIVYKKSNYANTRCPTFLQKMFKIFNDNFLVQSLQNYKFWNHFWLTDFIISPELNILVFKLIIIVLKIRYLNCSFDL